MRRIWNIGDIVQFVDEHHYNGLIVEVTRVFADGLYGVQVYDDVEQPIREDVVDTFRKRYTVNSGWFGFRFRKYDVEKTEEFSEKDFLLFLGDQ